MDVRFEIMAEIPELFKNNWLHIIFSIDLTTNKPCHIILMILHVCFVQQELGYRTNRLRLDIDCTVCKTWVEIDAVELVGRKYLTRK